MKNLLLICCILVSGCANMNPGTRQWLDAKIIEINQAEKDGKISYYEAQQLKIQAETARATLMAGAMGGDNITINNQAK